jgi:AsmA protein
MLRLGLSVLGLILVILSLLPTVVSLESVKGQLIAHAEAVLQRPVDVSRLRLQLLTGLGVGLEQLTVHNPPGWQYPHFVKAGTLSVKVAFLPLLQRKIAVKKIVLSDAEVIIERDAQGRMNYADLLQPRPHSGTTTPAIPGGDTSPTINPLAALLVSQVSLQNVHVLFADRLIVPGQFRLSKSIYLDVDLSFIVRFSQIDF